MRYGTKLFTLAVTILFLVRAAVAQEKKDGTESEVSEERGPIEFGFRTFWGDVYGRPDLPFRPDLATSKLNEYSDIRKNLFIRRARINLDNVFGGRNYFDYQTQSSF